MATCQNVLFFKWLIVYTFVRLMAPIFWLHDVTPNPEPTAVANIQSIPSINIPENIKNKNHEVIKFV